MHECWTATSNMDEDVNDDGELLPVPTIPGGLTAIATMRQVYESLYYTKREASMFGSLSRNQI